jgi:hypothetical protein
MRNLRPEELTANFHALADQVRSNGDALVITERRLRQAAGYGRWDPNLVPLVEHHLDQAGLRLFPGRQLRRRQNHEVIIYVRRTPLARIIEFSQQPNPWGLDRFFGDIGLAAGIRASRSTLPAAGQKAGEAHSIGADSGMSLASSMGPPVRQ